MRNWQARRRGRTALALTVLAALAPLGCYQPQGMGGGSPPPDSFLQVDHLLGPAASSGKYAGPACAGPGACGGKARVCEVPTVRALAHDLDELEEHIERYGSVVAKQPDVWGQARLTKYREEFEKVMEPEKDKFNDTLQGSLWRSDQAYFADAFALSAAVSGQQAGAAPPGRVVVSNANAANTAPASPITPPTLPDQSNTFAAFTSMTRTPVTPPQQIAFAAGSSGIQLEPTIHLDQKARFLNHLQELRRINEGDDTADSPGYSLNLVRIPVSVLPGKCTDKGCGAEVTMTMTPYLGDEFLPVTFRNLVLNDLVDQIGFPVTQFINSPENDVYFVEASAADLDAFIEYLDEHPLPTFDEIQTNPGALDAIRGFRYKPSLQALFTRPEWAWLDEYLRGVESVARARAEFQSAMPQANGAGASVEGSPGGGVQLGPKVTGPTTSNRVAQMEMNVRKMESEILSAARRGQEQQVRALHGALPIPATKSRRARLPFPPTQLPDVYGYDFLYHLTADAYRSLTRERF
ncbi:MAG TPA: hypothetical protein VFW33_02760, partial [Gemmataceae bacterium]|nr:hypothetical protein [Gemmataceae bacterium]